MAGMGNPNGKMPANAVLTSACAFKGRQTFISKNNFCDDKRGNSSSSAMAFSQP
jgi:hypothetical protein